MKALHFGAGNIGRGFIGLVLVENGYELTFSDVMKDLVDLLNQEKSYQVIIADGSGDKTTVKDFDAINSSEEPEKLKQTIVDTDLITMAVGPRIVPLIAKSCVEGIKARLDQPESEIKPLNIIACENAVGATDIFKEALLDELDEKYAKLALKNIGFPNSAVDRIVPAQHNENPLDVKVEPFFEWAIEKDKLLGDVPEMKDVHYVDDLTPYVERKLFTVNTGHATSAYFGLLAGYQSVDQAMADPAIEQQVRDVLGETSTYVLKTYDIFDAAEHQEYVDTIIERFKNPEISDDLQRVARGPIRKLSGGDRFVKPALGLLKYGVEPRNIAKAMAAALRFNNPEDPESKEIQDFLQDHDIKETLIKYSDLEADSPLIKLVEEESTKI
ncbi:MAG: mannitol-1-phosphate 5-dehydrogenase [Clostridiaceae bacterium]|jgi:mannitol-1-phosphate 5-dehydrogenase|nr:mannitol-1-phosphate 5-dehydrogenase [Bacillota bacterium]NLN52559.1 mannitol-1-phosphate 5-dehydrogenase [Clostridiaceae bacterium]